MEFVDTDPDALVSGEQEVIVGVYEDKPLKGPNSIIQDYKGNIYFTDSGPQGETGLNKKILYC